MGIDRIGGSGGSGGVPPNSGPPPPGGPNDSGGPKKIGGKKEISEVGDQLSLSTPLERLRERAADFANPARMYDATGQITSVRPLTLEEVQRYAAIPDLDAEDLLLVNELREKLILQEAREVVAKRKTLEDVTREMQEIAGEVAGLLAQLPPPIQADPPPASLTSDGTIEGVDGGGMGSFDPRHQGGQDDQKKDEEENPPEDEEGPATN